jgi:predicted acylesterase/phospholipase RssA
VDRKAARGEERVVHALVLSGCGCGTTDAFEIGVMEALLVEGASHLGSRPIDPAIYSGSAFGAFNAAVMAAQAGGDTVSTLRYLERVWLEDLSSTPGSCGNGVYRLRGNPLPFLNPWCYLPQPLRPFLQAWEDGVFLTAALIERCGIVLGSEGSWSDRLLSFPDLTVFFDMTPLQDNLRKHIDLGRLRRSAKELIVIASDWQRGKPRAFLKPEMTDERGYAILQASTAYLLAFPFVEIDGRLYGGGPGSMAIPLKPVIDLYARPGRKLVVHVISLLTPVEEVPLGQTIGALGGLGRYFNMNQLLNIKNDVEYGPHGEQAAPPKIAPGAVTIHHYRPRFPIINWFQSYNFERWTTAAHIAEGRNSVFHHDCAAEGCILANGPL